ncbi:response regulator [Thermodesulfitimonas autotrophica]|uniref:response regulator n=1 Tax=Thermodesulfitimonas autotrophica TaxID=1894989 RepID=UPI002FE2A1E6
MKTVLIIEDNPTNAKLVRDILELHGYNTLEATTAQHGITLAKEKRPDLIVMDIGLPGMDGLTATQLLKNDPVTAPIPILALTAYAMKGDAEKCFAAGCSAYLPKPISITGLLTQVKLLSGD